MTTSKRKTTTKAAAAKKAPSSKAASGGKKVAATKKKSGTTAPTVSGEEDELMNQITSVYRGFLRCSLDWTGGDDALEYRSSKLSLVTGKSYTNFDDGEELLVIKRKPSEGEEKAKPFTKAFLKDIRPRLVAVVNEIVEANNNWLEKTNYHEAHLHQNHIKEMLKLHLNPEVSSGTYPHAEEDIVYKGAIGIIRPSGNLRSRWDYMEACPQEIIDEYKGKTKGKEKKLTAAK